jgi:hypothetical protein
MLLVILSAKLGLFLYGYRKDILEVTVDMVLRIIFLYKRKEGRGGW